MAMISLIEIFGIVAIGFALNFIRIVAKSKIDEEEYADLDLKYSADEIESFVDIPLKHMTSNLDYDQSANIEELKEKIKRFKARNRFYT